MSRQKRRQTPKRQWEEALLEAYHDYRWRQVLDPLYEKFRRWKAGELPHADMNEAVHETHKQSQELYGLFCQKRDFLVGLAQWDEEWFDEWVKDHPPPPDVELAPRVRIQEINDDEVTNE
jgi:hypothetical protein